MAKPAPHGPRKRLIDDASLFARIVRPGSLQEAWTRVWRNGGAAGGDRVALEHFRINVMRRLSFLRQALISGTYTPGPLRHVEIPKPSGGVRSLDIPCVVDRVVQTAVHDALAPRLDSEFEEQSYAYRQGRGVRDAVARVVALRAEGHVHVVDADIEDFFGRIPHDALMMRLAESMTDGPITGLIGLWLEHWFPTGRGLAQGSPLSPLLANLYLDRLDEAFAARGAVIVRYADDFLVLCRSRAGADAALEKTRRLLAQFGLTLNEGKTRVTDFERGFRFLGHLFVRSLVMTSPEREAAHGGGPVAAFLRLVAQRDKAEAQRREAEEKARARDERAGFDRRERMLYLHRAGRRLNVRNHAFAVEEVIETDGLPEGVSDGGHQPQQWREILAVPHQEIARIEIGPDAHAVPTALDWALATDTEIAFVNGHGETLGWVARGLAGRARRQLAQAACILDSKQRIALARAFIDGRLRNQRALLRRLNRERKDGGVVRALAEINRMLRKLRQAEDTRTIMGYEGRATAVYWPALGRCLGHGFRLAKRERRPALDPVNIMLNMLAALLARDVAVALVRAGLHPGFGVLHAVMDRRDAAVFDLMEEFRAPLAESPVVAAINRRAVRSDMFTTRHDGRGVRMGAAATRALIRAYETAVNRRVTSARSDRRLTWRQIMEEQAQALGAHVEGGASYEPYVMSY